jgi:hypothetical protein
VKIKLIVTQEQGEREEMAKLLDIANHGNRWQYALQELDGRLKHDEKVYTSEDVRQLINDALLEKGVSLYE